MRRDRPWMLWEDEVCRRLGIDSVVASGATDNYKGDCKGSTVLVDCKYTDGASYRLTSSMWRKLSGWARNESRVPLLAVMLGGGGDMKVVVMPEWYYCEISNEDTSDVDAVSRMSVNVSDDMRDVRHVASIGAERVVSMPFDEFEAVFHDED